MPAVATQPLVLPVVLEVEDDEKLEPEVREGSLGPPPGALLWELYELGVGHQSTESMGPE